MKRSFTFSLNPSPTWVLFFSLVGFGLRVQRLDFQPLWGDEGWSFYLAGQPLAKLLALTALDIHPPLYYILLKIWLSFIGIGPEEARFFSVLVGTALIPTLYGLGRRLFDERVGIVGAAVTALMPLAIYYSQEARMYGLVTLLGAMSVYFFVRLSEQLKHPLLIAYLIVTAAALYTHYYASLIIFFQAISVLFTHLGVTQLEECGTPTCRTSPHVGVLAPQIWPQKKKRLSFKRFEQSLRPLVMVGVLYLPWILYLGPRLTTYLENKRNVEGYLPLNIIRFWGDHIVAFSLGHLPDDWRAYIWAALPLVLVASWGFIAALYANKNKPYRYLYLYLFVPLLVGYVINLFFPFNPPYFERTLLLVAPAYWLFIAAGLVWLWRQQRVIASTVVMILLLITCVSLLGFYNTPRYVAEDYRPLLSDIAARATPEDTVLASYQWQLGLYQAYLPEPRPRFFIVLGWGQGWAGEAGQPQLNQDVHTIFETSPRLWFPAYQAAGHIWEDEAETGLIHLGYPTLLKWYSPQTKLTLTGTGKATLVAGPTANFANRLRLIASKVGNESYQAGRGIIPVELTWQKMKSLGSEHQVGLRLVDATGRTWASRDSHPQGGQRFFTDLAIGVHLADRHGLLVPAGIPPGPYHLLLSVRRVEDARPLDVLDEQSQPLGAEVRLAEVLVSDPTPPLDPAALPVQVTTEAVFGEEVRLIGYTLGHGPFKAGQNLPLTLFWQSLLDQTEALTVSVQLQDKTGHLVVDDQHPPIRPATDWQQDTLVRDPHDVALPPTLPPGQYQLLLTLLNSNQTPLAVNGYQQLQLTTIETIDRPHNFEPPTPQIDLGVIFGSQARLVGIDLPQTKVKAGEALSLTLYWQGLAPFDRSWTVFVHLINGQGKIVSQQDQIPGAGQFPTTSWLPHEYLTDSYTLSIPAHPSGVTGSYQLKVGLYDTNNSSRLPVVDEAGKIVGDHVILDNWQILVQ